MRELTDADRQHLARLDHYRDKFVKGHRDLFIWQRQLADDLGSRAKAGARHYEENAPHGPKDVWAEVEAIFSKPKQA